MSTVELVRSAGMTVETKRAMRRRLWRTAARPEQRLPEGEWRIWYVQGGRGSGKTRSAAEALAELIESSGPGDWAIVAPTYGDARDVCIEGTSGLLQALGLPRTYHGWNRSIGELRLPGGGMVFVDGAEDGALRVQGKNLRGAWCDEIGLWRRSSWDIAWNESIAFAVRLPPARIIASGTPKEGHGLVRSLIADPEVRKSRLRTHDNVGNLSPAAVAKLEAKYAGTRRGRQELEGEFLDDTPGSLWTRAMIEDSRVSTPPHATDWQPDPRTEQPRSDMARIVVAVDPSGGSTEGHDEQGIVVVGKGADGHLYVFADLSCRLTPDGWGQRAVDAYRRWSCDRLVWEANYGGEMVEQVVRTAARSQRMEVATKKVTASRGKRLRAEPVAALYEQGRVHHVGGFPELEDQMCSWTPESSSSPDRLDALVWAVTELALEPESRRLAFRGAA